MSAILTTGPLALLAILITFLVLVPRMVRLVLSKSVPSAKDRDVSVTVRLLGWLRIEINVRAPDASMTATRGARSGDSPHGEVVPLREDIRDSG